MFAQFSISIHCNRKNSELKNFLIYHFSHFAIIPERRIGENILVNSTLERAVPVSFTEHSIHSGQFIMATVYWAYSHKLSLIYFLLGHEQMTNNQEET